MLLEEPRNGLHLIKNSPWIPAQLSDIRGLADWGEDWFIFTPYLSIENGSARIVPKESVNPRLIEQWKRKRDHLCKTLVPIGDHNVKGQTVWISSQPIPNHECCIESVIVLEHAKRLYSECLGDCWLVRFESGGTSFIDSESLYVQQDNVQLTLL
jgi:hypothetical protein